MHTTSAISIVPAPNKTDLPPAVQKSGQCASGAAEGAPDGVAVGMANGTLVGAADSTAVGETKDWPGLTVPKEDAVGPVQEKASRVLPVPVRCNDRPSSAEDCETPISTDVMPAAGPLVAVKVPRHGGRGHE